MGVTDSRVAGRITEGIVMTDKMSIAIAAGGTAGHVNPALALADELASRGHDVRFFGETRRLEGKLVPEAGFDFFPVEVTGFDRARPGRLSLLSHIFARGASPGAHLQGESCSQADVAIGFGAMSSFLWCGQRLNSVFLWSCTSRIPFPALPISSQQRSQACCDRSAKRALHF